jgi:hypothetical protein
MLDAVVQIALGLSRSWPVRAGLRHQSGSDALLADEVELDPEALVAGIEQAESVAAETVHVAVAGGMPRSLITMVI